MDVEAKPIPDERPLTAAEYQLARWMLEHGGPEAQGFLPQLDLAHVVSRCPCGCASIDFEVAGYPRPAGGLRVLGDFIYGGENDLSGAFIFERDGVLAGIEVYGLAGDAPKTLPQPDNLRPFNASPAA
ncbi:MAG: hypothetical protein LC778_09660 [Acidobacteria bacterium]|nr:hypothetical protein [Acidobacteriota bacterium]